MVHAYQRIWQSRGVEQESKETIRWEALEYRHKKKSGGWYVTILVVAAALILTAIFLNNFLFIVLIIIAVFTLFLHAARHPERVSFAITPQGIRIKNDLYPFGELESFWVHDEAEAEELYVKSSRALSYLRLPLDDTDPDHVRAYLLHHLKEKRVEIGVIDTVAEFLGF